jgi:hypothetical protein
MSNYECWEQLFVQTVLPVLTRFDDFVPEYSPHRKIPNKNVARIELFCRTMYASSGWYMNAASSEQKQLVRNAFQRGIETLQWDCDEQLLVEIGQLCLGLMRCPALWRDLLPGTKTRVLGIVRKADGFPPHNNNWKLFSASVKLFLARECGKEPSETRKILREFEKWYVGDGWYADGQHFAMDYYNSIVILPFLRDLYEMLGDRDGYKRALRYLQRQAVFLERLIHADGSYPMFGRSAVYRCGVFHALAYAAWKDVLPTSLDHGTVRAALTAVLRRTFVPANYDDHGFLYLGFHGFQPSIADSYSNNGSAYLTLLVFLPLALDRMHPFWTAEAKPMTHERIWNGECVGVDKKLTT